MRIVVAHSRLNSLGGGERCVLELAKGLSVRHEVVLWAGAYDAPATYPELSGFPRVDVPVRGWLTWTPHSADAVVTNSFAANLLALRHPRTLCYLHTLRSEYLRRGGRLDLLARRGLDVVAVRRAYAVATNSDYTATRASERYHRSIEVVAPGVDSAFFKLPVHAGEYALYVGRIAPEKGVERLLRWSAPLDMDLWIVGDGKPEYVAVLRSLAGPRVRFLGGLTGQALLDAYCQARMVVFLPYEEEFGLAALEAMAAGKPVIASREGGLLELVNQYETGIFVTNQDDYHHAVNQLISDDTLCLRLGALAREQASAYTWDRFTRGIERLCLGERA